MKIYTALIRYRKHVEDQPYGTQYVYCQRLRKIFDEFLHLSVLYDLVYCFGMILRKIERHSSQWISKACHRTILIVSANS